MGEYFQQCIWPKYNIDAHLRMDPETLERTADVADISMVKQLMNGFKNYNRGRYVTITLGDMLCRSSHFSACNTKVDKSKKESHRKYESPEIEGLGEDIK